MSDVDYHHEHWHVNTNKSFALPEFRPESPFDDLGRKGDLGIGGEYVEVQQIAASEVRLLLSRGVPGTFPSKRKG